MLSALIVLLAFTLSVAPVSAELESIGSYNPYHGMDPEGTSSQLGGVFPVVTLEPVETSSPKAPASQSAFGTSGFWVTISPFTATLGGVDTSMIAGYVGGTRTGVSLTITGKKSSDESFSDITTMKADENGLFVWAVPAGTSFDLYRVTGLAGTEQVLSNSVRFTAAPAVSDPVIKPVSSLPTPIQTPVSMVSNGASGPTQSRLTISASTGTPAVGEDVTISGRLTDKNGKGISGATINIDEAGYPGAAQAEPFETAGTDSEGRFEVTIQTAFANMVSIVANYEGDDNHLPAESNSLSFVSHEA
ncbi:MAG TPA: hypothetical protein VN372_12845 [Methanospirillum sp.]|nr:hypothetical protein [Methanospirillum sp.]